MARSKKSKTTVKLTLKGPKKIQNTTSSAAAAQISQAVEGQAVDGRSGSFDNAMDIYVSDAEHVPIH